MRKYEKNPKVEPAAFAFNPVAIARRAIKVGTAFVERRDQSWAEATDCSRENGRQANADEAIMADV